MGAILRDKVAEFGFLDCTFTTEYRGVSTPTIRSRILKAPSKPGKGNVARSFNPNDPFEDTERVLTARPTGC